MKVTRRTGLGAILGGMFAGPSVAKDMVNSTRDLGMVNTKWPGAATDNTKDNYLEKMAEEAKQINKMKEEAENTIAGKFNEYQKNRLRDTGRTKYDIASLKSVTKATKSRMWESHQKQQMKQIWIEEAKQNLLRFLGWKKGDKYTYNHWGAQGPDSSYDTQEDF